MEGLEVESYKYNKRRNYCVSRHTYKCDSNLRKIGRHTEDALDTAIGNANHSTAHMRASVQRDGMDYSREMFFQPEMTFRKIWSVFLEPECGV